jgi:ABC-type lipoprotein export system ATPase subunit
MIEVKNLTYSYPGTAQPAVNNASVFLPSKGLYYVIGESGSGKSTFMKLVCGLIKNYRGKILIDGAELSRLSEKEKAQLFFSKLSLSMQADLLASKESVEENLLVPLELTDLSQEEKKNRVRLAAKELSIESLLKEKCSTLSGGEIKRVSLARVLVKPGQILFLDEPLGPLDGKMRERITGLLKSLALTKLVIVITHNTAEIGPKDNVMSFKDGVITTSFKKKIEKGGEPLSQNLKRKKYSCSSKFRAALRLLVTKKRHALFSSFASSLALVSFGLISLISSGISSGLKSYLAGSEEKTTLLVERREKEIESALPVSASYSEAVSALACLDENLPVLMGCQFNFENTFINKNTAYFEKGSNRLGVNSISARSFMEYTYLGELSDDDKTALKGMKLNDEEIILGLAPSDQAALASFCQLTSHDYIPGLNDYLKAAPLILHLDLEASAFRYSLESLFQVAAFISTTSTKVIHTDPLFGEYFFEDNMRFKTVQDQKEMPDNPWTGFKYYFAAPGCQKRRDFLEKAKSAKALDGLVFLPLGSEQALYCQEKDELTHDRVKIMKEEEKGLYYSDICQMEKHYQPALDNLYLSDSFYYCSDQGLAGGFLKPVYVSAHRDLLNQIADFNYEAKFDLNGFQGSSIVFSEGVVMGDLSGVQKKELSFRPYVSPPELKMGSYPRSFTEVLASSGLVSYLFGTSPNGLNQPLYLTCLKQTVYLEGGYKNIFADGTLKITGIVEEENYLLYQAPRFLEILGEDQLGLKTQDGIINKALLVFKGGYGIQGELESLKAKYPEYAFSLPGTEMAKDIDKVISSIDKGLGAFAFFASAIACSLLCVVLFLFVREGGERIKMLQAVGYLTKEISDFYWMVGFILAGASYVSSSCFLIVFSFFFSKGLEEALGLSLKAFIPEMFAVNLLATSVFSLLAGLLSSVLVKKKSAADWA